MQSDTEKKKNGQWKYVSASFLMRNKTESVDVIFAAPTTPRPVVL